MRYPVFKRNLKHWLTTTLPLVLLLAVDLVSAQPVPADPVVTSERARLASDQAAIITKDLSTEPEPSSTASGADDSSVRAELTTATATDATDATVVIAETSETVEEHFDSAARARAMEPVAVSKVIKSERDARDYRHLLLPNGLRVLLISDPSTEKSAAALNVNVGHNQNPVERPGLAHFLEHMLFLGTKKYPKAGDYYAFINQHGGHHNAYTTAEHTNYFFEIDAQQLEPALDRFAQFFIAPLFDPAYVERERHAVHSEYRARINEDGRRALDVYRELMNPAHPAAGFGVGTLETLADREEEPVADALIKFYTQFYSADLMTLVVLGREPLAELQRITLERFAFIAAREPVLPSAYPPVFSEDFLPAQVQIKPEKEVRQLSFLFPIPNPDNFYRKKPFDFLAHLLGHEGEGSIFSLLKQLGWAERLSAGVDLKSRYDSFFQITIDLTETGVKAREQIPTLIFHMIEQLEVRGIKDWRYDELRKMADINFRFQEKLSPVDTVRRLAQAMHEYPAEDVLRGNFLFGEYDETLIKQSLSYLRKDNLLLVLTAPDVTTTETSFYYQTPYRFSSWKAPGFEVKPTIRRRLYFPEPNIFIPARIAVKAKPMLPTPGSAGSVVETPQAVVQNARVQAWFLQDQHFNVPKTHINLRLKLPMVARDSAGAAQAHLFAALVADQLNELTYPASVAGLHHSISANARGLDINIAGYSERQGLLLNKIAGSIRKGRFAEERFNLLKADVLRSWRNHTKNSPYQVMMRQIPALHFEPYWSEQALSRALEKITFDEFQKFSIQILRDGHLEALLYGNLYRQEAIKLAVLAEHQLLGQRMGKAPAATRVFQLTDADKPWLYRQPLSHDDYIMLLYVQGLADTPADAAHMQLLRQILQPVFFDQLRTEKQLGYVVAVLPLALRTLEGSVFMVQSPATDELQLVGEIDQFLLNQQSIISENLQEHQQALVHRLLQPSRSLAEQAERFWESILLGDYQWDRRQKLAVAVADVTPTSLAEYYGKVMLDRNRRLWLSSSRIAPGDDFSVVENIADYRARQRALIYR